MCKLNYFDVLHNISFIEHVPDNGDNRRPTHVAGYAVYNTKNIHNCTHTCWLYFS
jgi:hypothetical protein